MFPGKTPLALISLAGAAILVTAIGRQSQMIATAEGARFSDLLTTYFESAGQYRVKVKVLPLTSPALAVCPPHPLQGTAPCDMKF